MIKAVLFDVYGTIAGWQPSRYEIQKEACAAFGLAEKITPDGILKGYGAADSFMTAENSVSPIRLRDEQGTAAFFGEYERLVLEGCAIQVSPERALEIFAKVRQVPYNLVPFDDVIPTLTTLRERGLIVGLISNIDQPGRELMDDLGLTEYLDFAVTSGEIGAEKPNAVVFHAALDRAGVAPNEAVMVGDQPSSDIEGAIRVGIVPILIDRDGNNPLYDKCPRITSLVGLSALIE
jgi:putative hydrolase of the HAD superfamily